MTKLYRWEGIDSEKKIKSGELVSDKKANVTHYLRRRKIIPTKISRQFTFTQKNRLLLKFTQQLSLLINANLPLDKALEIVQKSETDRMLSTIIDKILIDLTHGQELFHSLKKLPSFFPKLYTIFIETGEKTNQLGKCLKILEKFLSHRNTVSASTLKALRYPFFILLCILVFSIGIFCFIIPQYQSFFKDLGGKLPVLTLTLLRWSHFIITHSVTIIIIISMLGASLLLFYRKAFMRQALQHTALKIPWLKSLILTATLHQWCQIMTLSCHASIDILQAVILANQSIKNIKLSAIFKKIPKKLQAGKTLSTALNETGILHSEVTQLITTGEYTNTLESVFESLSQYYQKRLHNTLDKLVKYVEPIAMILLASLAGIIITSLYLPMINFSLRF